jgi:hypothetical protein
MEDVKPASTRMGLKSRDTTMKWIKRVTIQRAGNSYKAV